MNTKYTNPAVRTGYKLATILASPSRISLAEMRSLSEILNYTNPKVIERYMNKMNISIEEAKILLKDVILFLYLCAITNGKLEITPTVSIDEGWHEFIMFTKDYQQFCKQNFGFFIHHQPFTINDKVNRRGSPRKVAVDLAQELTSSILSQNWTVQNHGAGDCGSGDCSSGDCSGDCCPYTIRPRAHKTPRRSSLGVF